MSDRKPRILLGVTADMSLRLMQGFPQYLAERGWDVHVVSSPGPALDELQQVPGVTSHAIRMAREPSPLRDIGALSRWIAVVGRVRPDIVSVGTPKAGLLGSLAGWITRIPVRVYMLRGLRLESAHGLTRSLLVALERLAMASSHIVLSVSASLRSLAIELGLVRPSKILTLGAGSSNGVDLHRFKPGAISEFERDRLKGVWGVDSRIPVVGFVGRLTEDKGLSTLAEARVILDREGVGHQLLLVGGVDNAAAKSSLDKLRRSGRGTVETGHVEDTAAFYQLIDVLCLPTRREGFPNVVLEAASAGVPAVTTKATGAIDSVLDGKTVLIAEVGNSESLAHCLSALITNEQMRRRLGSNARRWVVENYDQTHVWKTSEEFFNSLLRSIPRVSRR